MDDFIEGDPQNLGQEQCSLFNDNEASCLYWGCGYNIDNSINNCYALQDSQLCVPGGASFIVPLFGQNEHLWSFELRGLLYFIGLFWCFIGVAIIADIFMSAIEMVTSVKTRVRDPKTGRMKTLKVWNDTVANLTLMAMGSSAPEILLSVIEILNKKFYSGKLGPSTIIGSAAFNLFCISAVCIYCLPKGQSRRIKDMPVYCVTAFFSIFAYLWLIIILQGSSPNVVTPAEGVITFLFFPVVVILAFLADKGYFSDRRESNSFIPPHQMTMEELSNYAASLERKTGQALKPEELLIMMEEDNSAPKSRAQYRVLATRQMMGGPQKFRKGSTPLKDSSIKPAVGCTDAGKETKPAQIVQFKYAKAACLENAGSISLQVVRKGEGGGILSVKYKTRDGTAKAGSDYSSTEGLIKFQPEEEMKIIEIPIIDDAAFEQEEEFYVDLYDPVVDVGGNKPLVQLGSICTATVIIIDDDLAGTLEWEDEYVELTETLEDITVPVNVKRRNGSTGKIGCRVYSEDHSAVAPLDFEAVDCTVEMENGQNSAHIDVVIKARGRYEGSEVFRLIMTEPTGGAKFNIESDGGEDTCICTIKIVAESGRKDMTDKLQKLVIGNWDVTKIGTTNWKQQFVSASYCNGSKEEQAEASLRDWISHAISFPWKFFFALVPPTTYANGWLSFFAALGFIAVVTAIISDMATAFGCSIGMREETNAITFVALGTSLPDLFASYGAAEASEYADASIGNITGSNAVNVFLGLGLPWMIAAIYWSTIDDPIIKAQWRGTFKDFDWFDSLGIGEDETAFVVPAGDLGFSVIIFCSCAVLAMILLFVRRTKFEGELGGPQGMRIFSAITLVGLWLLYICVSTARLYQSDA